MSIMSTIYIDRERASQILKVSTRTIDRYIRKYRFKTRKTGRKVLIRRADIESVIKKHIGQFIDENKLDGVLAGKEGKNPHKEAKLAVSDFKVQEIRKKELSDRVEGVYKELYLETKKEIKEKQERLEAATYRVGQLETQVKNMVPLLDYNRKEKELKEASIAIEQKVLEGQSAIKEMERKLRTERIAKWIYVSLVGLLLIAEPILFLFWAFS